MVPCSIPKAYDRDPNLPVLPLGIGAVSGSLVTNRVVPDASPGRLCWEVSARLFFEFG